MICPKCGQAARDGARFCEQDGTRLSTNIQVDTQGFGPCRCGAEADAIDDAGFCTECGIRRTVRVRDHMELDAAPNFAGVTDRGKRHQENQDDFAMGIIETASGAHYVGIVCDGVSGSEGAADASEAASNAALAHIEKTLKLDPAADLAEVLRDALSAANLAVAHVSYAPGSIKDPPETTIVATIVPRDSDEAHIAWMGDSRAYCISSADASQLTRDHSWLNDVVDNGKMSLEEAMKSPLRHAVVNCLGGVQPGTEPPSADPSIASAKIHPGDLLLLCSDGLWNYAEELDQLADLVRDGANETPIETARRLAQYANECGGKDNVTAVIFSR